MKIQLIDINLPLCNAWKSVFYDTNVEIIQGDIFKTPTDCIVSPANSFGFMDGGLDYYISEYLGWDIQEKLQKKIAKNYNGELLVGQAEIIETKHKDIPFCLCAPTMRVPLIIKDTVNVYLAMKAILTTVKDHPQIKTISIPGLGTGVGQINLNVCAKQMRKAYEDFWINNYTYPINLKQASLRHMNL